MTEEHNINNIATIDGHPVKVRKGLTILEAAQKSGIYIPTLCHLEKLEPYGGCRLCVVHVKKMKGFPTACTTPIEPGMEILTRTPELQKLRREILEFTLSEHPFTCLVCKDKQECTDFMHSTRKVSTITGCNFCTSNGDCELQDLVETLELKDINQIIAEIIQSGIEDGTIRTDVEPVTLAHIIWGDQCGILPSYDSQAKDFTGASHTPQSLLSYHFQLLKKGIES